MVGPGPVHHVERFISKHDITMMAQYFYFPSFAAFTRDIYDIVPQAIKLISPRPL